MLPPATSSSSSSSAKCTYPETNRAAIRASEAPLSYGEVTTTATPEIERPNRSLDFLLVPRYVLEGPPDGPRHVADSFTPVFEGATRPWHAGVLYNRDPRFAHHLMALLNAAENLFVGANAPYIVSDVSDYTIPVHAERRGLHHVLIEIRQDLIAGENGQRNWAARLARLLPQAHLAL